jgi:flavin-dependent dehydrogenase
VIGATDVFVIGGGPAGLATAIAARQRGFDVTIADQAVPPIDKACGEGLMPDGLAAARSLGVEFDGAGGYAFQGIRFRDGATSVEACFPSGRGMGLRRTTLHRMLVERAGDAGVRTLWGTRVNGIREDGVQLEDGFAPARWIVGADGGHSRVRGWAGLNDSVHESRRFGFRRHYRIAPWSEFMEIHWGAGHQTYITPVAANEICVALISRDPHLRLDDALPAHPELLARLRAANVRSVERGGVSVSRRLKSVYRGNTALVGDASGSVDAITGEGLCLLFQQAVALADGLAGGDLAAYQAAHRRIGRRPAFMADFMLLMDGRGGLRRRAIRAMADEPKIFTRMLAMHVGELSLAGFLGGGLALGWRMLSV